MTQFREVRCPPIDPALIEYLQHMFPDKVADPRVDDVSMKYGQVTVVRHLRSVMEDQQEEPYVPA